VLPRAHYDNKVRDLVSPLTKLAMNSRCLLCC
jgi:hypothetical protein